ncbi:L-proline dehydrogenase [Neolewinella xylanilytica]|uniref:L-proline dehydrogenase n=1 Tax=Neolewinella xylanilytica TaxID=1514080 RepID=A0A2S6I5L9_9BACT|nr:proline dehydrogenase family protein [Neolewinella xylanilytica]PPK86452.1 L-proline dehydrogenase [Neolewinella xylanilytica]
MKEGGGPVRDFSLAEQVRKDFTEQQQRALPDFSDTALTFRHLSDSRLLGTRRLFRLMGNRYLTKLMGTLGMRAVEWSLPGASWMVRNTVYKQFVGGTDFEDAQQSIAQLAKRGVDSILDYGAEGKHTRSGMDASMQEVLRATDFCAKTDAAIGSVVKLSGLVRFSILESYNDKVIDFENVTDPELKEGIARLDRICKLANEQRTEVYLDAEESWIQSTVDQIAEYMMARYNRERHTVFTTCQMYRHDRLAYLKALHLRSRQNGFNLALKIVRGAYMNKENKRARTFDLRTPIQPTLEATHRDFNAAAEYCLEHHQDIACCLASHNEESVVRHIRRMVDMGVARDHPNIRFSQLLGMSDNLTFNLAEGGYNVSKYMVYGPVHEVLPYLVRRAEENTSVTGEAGRELRMLDEEVARRGL